MRIALSRLAVALGLLALAPVCAAKSYVILLKSPLEDMENHVHIINSKGVFGIHNPGYGAPISQRIETVRRYESDQINADFSQALESMSEILAAGLPPLPYSYTALLEKPQGPLGNIAYRSERGSVVLDSAGEGVKIDGTSDEPFRVDDQQIKRDFGPALASLDEIIRAGFRPKSYIVLLEDPDGGVGKVIISDDAGKTTIGEAGQALDMGVSQVGERVFKVDEQTINEDFGYAIESRPKLPAKYVLLFQIGGTKLVAESEAEASKLLEDVKSRPAPDITINGHADTVGRDALNDKLSKQRAEYVAGLIKTQVAELQAMEIEYYGKRKPYVPTPDNTPELKNRRVEVTVR